MARVKLEGVRKIYGDGRGHVAVHGVDFEVGDGEFLVLVGPSGCGKSTTLRMIAGLESISAGRLLIGDRVVNDVPAKERDIAMVFQNYALYPHMSVYENMAFALKLRKLEKREIDERVSEAAEILGIEGVLDRRPRQLSGGQRQRVAVGRAIVRKPQVFLFDEPLSNLDAKLRLQMRRELARLHQELGATMIYVTHDQVEAMTLGNRIVVLNEGRVQQIDAPLPLYEHPRNMFVAGFIGSPPMNLIPGTIVRAEGLCVRMPGGVADLGVPPEWECVLAPREGQDVVLGIRPEDIRVTRDGAEDGGAPVHVRLTLVEPMGNEVLLHASAAGSEVTARVPPHVLPRAGTEITLLFDREKMHFFDPETQASLR